MRRVDACPRLSKREIECLMWASKDMSVKETSAHMKISPETVKYYRLNAMNKTGNQTITGAACYAIKNGYL